MAMNNKGKHARVRARRVYAKMVRTCCVCVGRLSLHCTVHKTNKINILAELNYSSAKFGPNITRLHKFKIGFLTAEIHIANQLT